VRVPVLRGHSIAAWVKTAKPLSPARALALLSKAEGVKVLGRGAHQYPTALQAHGTGPVYVGRLRAGTAPNELLLWIVGDNLLKGAALNSVQIAELMLKKGWLRAR
jgi:aspartate-semialdehyde dehydrogenase